MRYIIGVALLIVLLSGCAKESLVLHKDKNGEYSIGDTKVAASFPY